MKNLIISVILFCSLIVQSHSSEPITHPINWQGLDTLSKYSRVRHFFNKVDDKFYTNRDEILDQIINDPRVLLSTYCGGNGYDCIYGLAVDSKNNIVLAGYTGSTDLPVTDGAFQKTKSGGHDAFIAKVSPLGQIIWFTYYGGNGTDVALDCICDSSDNVIICGKTNSTDFPVTEGTYIGGQSDCFIVKFDTDGNRIWAKFFGSEAFDSAEGIALASDGTFAITGYTDGAKLPTTEGVFQTYLMGRTDAFVAKFDKDGNKLWCTYYGGYQDDIAQAIAIDKNGNIAFTGYTRTVSAKEGPKFPVSLNAFQIDTSGGKDCFVVVLTPNGQRLWATLYGGNKDDLADDIKFDNLGNLYFVGLTLSENFPISSDAYQTEIKKGGDYMGEGFIVKFDIEGKRKYATYFGGNSGEEIYSISFDKDNHIWVTGLTLSVDFPIKGQIFKTTPTYTDWIFISKFNNNQLEWSSLYFSGFSYKILSSQSYNFIIAGETPTFNFPVTENAFLKQNPDYSGTPYTGFLVVTDSIVTGIIENLNKNNNIKICLNSVNEIYILFNNIFDNNIKITITDILGNVLYNNQISNLLYSDNLIININNYPNGIYFLSIQSGYNIYYTKFLK